MTENPEQLFMENRGLAYAFVLRMNVRTDDFDDFHQEALIGLWIACQRYDESRAKLSTYAWHWMRMTTLRFYHSSRLIRVPCDWRNVKNPEIRFRAQQAMKTIFLGLIDDPEDEDVGLTDWNEASEPDKATDEDKKLLMEQVMAVLPDLNERHKKILCQRFGLNGERVHVLREIGSSLGLSKERVRQIEQQALNCVSDLLKHRNALAV